MPLPVVAIVGRPNVGKSSLFNWLAGRRIAIVDPTAGVTRDRLAAPVTHADRSFELIDTGGIGIVDVDDLTEHVERQIEIALAQADVVLFVVDVRDGVVPLDAEVAERLRHVAKPVLLVVNKCDTPQLEPQAAEFYALGHDAPIKVSAQNNRGRLELLDRVADLLPPAATDEAAPDDSGALKLALVGRRNTGKSTFINSVAKAERVIVSAVPGTTRDSVDVRFERDGKVYVAIDTAGVRKKKSLANDIEFYSLHRAERSIRRADVVLLFLDARLAVSKVDKQLAEYIVANHKPAIFVVNKWDLMRALATGTFADYLRKHFPSLDYVPIAFVTAKDGKNVYRVLELARTLFEQASAHIGTGEINRVLRAALEAQPPPQRQNRRPKVFYGTQAGTNPPTIVLFTNEPDLFDETYHRYLVKAFRDGLPFNDIPIKLVLRRRARDDGPPSRGRDAEPETPPTPTPSKKKRPKDGPTREKRHSDSELWKDV